MFSRISPWLASVPCLAILALVACADSTVREGFEAEKSGETGDAGTGSNGGFQPTADSGAVSPDGCSEEAKLVYVLSLEGDLYSFAPAAKKFTKIGPLDCVGGSDKLVPVSMAVDRKATAWVNMRSEFGLPGEDRLYKVDTKTAECTSTKIQGSMGGMGFSVNEGTTDQETLFVIGLNALATQGALHRVDFDKDELVPIADLKEQIDLELTGTGDGKLYGFVIDDPLALATVNKKTTALSNRVTLSEVQRPMAPMFAFSFWGGDFYFYTATNTSPSTTTTVARYRPSDDSIDSTYMKSIGFHIVGAGVSTCAPTSGPK